MNTLFLFFVAYLASIVSAIVGMAGGTVLLGAMTFVVPVFALVPIHGCVQLSSNLSRAVILKEHVRMDLFWYFLMGLPFGTFLSYILLDSIKDERLLLALIALVILWALFKPKRFKSIQIPTWAFIIVGIVTGFISLLVGAVGPFLGAFFLRDDMNKEEVIASQAAAQIVTHALKIPAFLFLGFRYQDHLWTIGIMSLATVFGTRLGVNLLSKFKEKTFQTVFRAALLFSALRLIYKIFFP